MASFTCFFIKKLKKAAFFMGNTPFFMALFLSYIEHFGLPYHMITATPVITNRLEVETSSNNRSETVV